MYCRASGICELPWCMSTMGDFHTSGAGRYQMCQTNSTVFSPFLFRRTGSRRDPGEDNGHPDFGQKRRIQLQNGCRSLHPQSGLQHDRRHRFRSHRHLRRLLVEFLIDVVEAADDAGTRKRGNALRSVLRVERHVLLKTRSHEKFILHTVRIFVPAAVGIVHRGEARHLPAPRRKRCGDTSGRKIPDPAALSSVGLGAGIRRTHPFARLPALCRREADRTGPGGRHTGRRRKQLPLSSRHASVRKLPAGVRRQRRAAHDDRNHRCTGAALHRLSGGKGRRRPVSGQISPSR